jgi:hypothetical protein
MKPLALVGILIRGIIIGVALNVYAYFLGIPSNSPEYLKFLIIGSILLNIVISIGFPIE